MQWYFASMTNISPAVSFGITFVSLISCAISSSFRRTWKVWHMCNLILLSSLSQKRQVGVNFSNWSCSASIFFVFQYFLNFQSFQSYLVQLHVLFRIAFFLHQSGLIVLSNAIFMKDGFIFHKWLCNFVLIFKSETLFFQFNWWDILKFCGNTLQIFGDTVARMFCWIKA